MCQNIISFVASCKIDDGEMPLGTISTLPLCTDCLVKNDKLLLVRNTPCCCLSYALCPGVKAVEKEPVDTFIQQLRWLVRGGTNAKKHAQELLHHAFIASILVEVEMGCLPVESVNAEGLCQAAMPILKPERLVGCVAQVSYVAILLLGNHYCPKG